MIPLPVYTEAALLTLEAGRTPVFPDDGHSVSPDVSEDVFWDVWIDHEVAHLLAEDIA